MFIEFVVSLIIGHVHIGVIFYCIGNSRRCLYNTQTKSDWLFTTQSKILQADWLILGKILRGQLINSKRKQWTWTSSMLARFPDVYWNKLYNIGIWVCFSCTLLSAVPQPGRLLQQPYIAGIEVTTRASIARHLAQLVCIFCWSWAKVQHPVSTNVRTSNVPYKHVPCTGFWTRNLCSEKLMRQPMPHGESWLNWQIININKHITALLLLAGFQ